MSSDHKTDTRSGGVEVVADKGDDGSFEIRLERQDDAAAPPEPADTQRAATWDAQPQTEPKQGTSKRILIGGLAVAAMIVLVVGIVLAQSPRQLGGGRPQTVDVQDQPSFRGYVVAGQEPERAVNLRLDGDAAPADSQEQQNTNDNAALEAAPDPDGPTRINLRSAAAGASSASSDAEEQLSERELRNLRKKERREKGQADLERELEKYARRRDARAPNQAPEAELDVYDDPYEDEFLEDELSEEEMLDALYEAFEGDEELLEEALREYDLQEIR